MHSNQLLRALLCGLLTVLTGAIMAQCGTTIPREHVDSPTILEGQQRETIQYDLDRTLSVHIYIVASGLDTYDYSAADYEPNWEIVNENFAPLGLSFEICSETLIPNYQFNFITDYDEPQNGFRTDADLMSEYYTDNVINVYYVQDILSSTGIPAAGYAYFPGGPDCIVLEKTHGDLTIEHELGHFFGLYHTFETSMGNEFVDGSNCATTGDLVCDTPADNDGNLDGCQYDDLSTDGNGEHYTPYTSNIMSYYGVCRCKFTNGQFNRMAAIYLAERNYLW